MPQETLAQVRAMLQQRGLPLTTDNLNRGMLALAQNNPASLDGIMGQIDAQVAASPTPPPRQRGSGQRPNAATPSAPAGSGTYRGTAAKDAEKAVAETDSTGEAGRRAIGGPSNLSITENGGGYDTGLDMREEANAPTAPRRRGGVNGAMAIDENDPTAGMFSGSPIRQANEEGVNQLALAAALGIPIAALMALPAAGAARGGALVARQPLITGVNRPPPAAGAPVQLPSPPPMLPPGGAANALPAPATALPAPSAVSAPNAMPVAQEARAAAMQMAGRPATSMPRNTGPSRGQQSTGTSDPNAAPPPNTSPQLPFHWGRNRPAPTLREQLARNRAQARERGRRASGE